MNSIHRRAFFLLTVSILIVAVLSSAQAMVYSENLEYYSNQAYVQKYIQDKSPITSDHFQGNETSEKKACKNRFSRCRSRLKELGYYMGGSIYRWSQPVLDGISLFAQQSGLGEMPKNKIPLVIEAVLMSDAAEHALIPAANPSDYKQSTVKKLIELSSGDKVALNGQVSALENVLDNCIEYRITDDSGDVIVSYNTPARASTFIVGDRVSVFGRLERENNQIKIIAEMVAFTN